MSNKKKIWAWVIIISGVYILHIWNMEYGRKGWGRSVSDPYSSNPDQDQDPAKNLNPDPDPVPDPSYFLPLSEIFFITS